MGNCRYSTQKREKPIMSIAWHEDKTDKSDYQEHMLRIPDHLIQSHQAIHKV